MLAEARDFSDFKALRDWATTLRAYGRARGLGIEAENEAAEYVLRAERGAGAELIRMVETGERPQRGGLWKGVAHDADGRVPRGPLSQDNAPWKTTLRKLGISGNDAMDWQRLARIPDQDFENLLKTARRMGRVSKARFYQRVTGTLRRSDYQGSDPFGFESFRAAAKFLLDEGLRKLSPDDLNTTGKLAVELVKATRAEMDRRTNAA